MSNADIRIESTQKNIEKLEEKISRIKKAFESGKNPYSYNDSDLRRAEHDLAYYNKKLKEYKDKKEADNSVELIPVIEEFLEAWKVKAIEWYKEEHVSLVAYLKSWNKKKEAFRKWKEENGKLFYREDEETKAKAKELGVDEKEHITILRMRYNALSIKLLEYKNKWESKLIEEVEKEKVSKRKLLIARVKSITGEITDATGLYIGLNCEINGIIVGKKGIAKVETISAGGYNIQCYHFRVLVKEINK